MKPCETQLLFKGKRSDTFADHFASLIPPGTTNKDIRVLVKFKVDILWKGGPLSCIKSFETQACKLCAKERLEILKFTKKTPQQAFNKSCEIFGGCRHNPHFHRFDDSPATPSTLGTDDSPRD